MIEARLHPVRSIRIHCPIAPETFSALARGQLDAIESDTTAARILALIRADNEMGDFGLYRGVFELSLGLEGFSPTAQADPTLGQAGVSTLSPTAIITTYVAEDIGEAGLAKLLADLANLHPWQIPVIEVSRPGQIELFK